MQTSQESQNVEVELLDSNNNSLAKTTTDSNGKYQFDNLDMEIIKLNSQFLKIM